MTQKIEVEFVDVPVELRPAVLGSTNLLEDAPMASEEQISELFDKVFDDIS